jgi:beta-phosphoglucomutase-like phosphatase (HAD superfamily)
VTFKLPIPPGVFEAYLFDCDGTVADSMPLHYLAWKQALGEWGCTFTEEHFYELGGLPIIQIIELLGREQGIDMPLTEVAKRKEDLYFEYLPKLQCVLEVREHIDHQHGRIPLAIVSGSTRDSVEASLRAIGLLNKFEVLVCAGDYTKSKPHPEPFLIAAQRLGVIPEACLVFEDTQMGIDAARGAGMAFVHIPAPWERSSMATR